MPRERWAARLVASGLDAESARVLVNSLEGANPPALPEASFSPGTNPLAPRSFAFADLGLRGDPVTVGAYWMAFGAAIALMVGLLAALDAAGLLASPSALAVATRVLGALAAVAFAWGAWKVAAGMRVRRR